MIDTNGVRGLENLCLVLEERFAMKRRDIRWRSCFDGRNKVVESFKFDDKDDLYGGGTGCRKCD